MYLKFVFITYGPIKTLYGIKDCMGFSFRNGASRLISISIITMCVRFFFSLFSLNCCNNVESLARCDTSDFLLSFYSSLSLSLQRTPNLFNKSDETALFLLYGTLLNYFEIVALDTPKYQHSVLPTLFR